MNIPIGLTSGLLFFLMIPLGLAAPRNDNLNSATPIKTLPYTQQQDTSDASNEANETVPLCSNEAENSVWYQYTPKNNQDVVFDTFGSNYDTTLSVWQGKNHPLTYLACNDDSSGTPQSQVRVELERNKTYYLNISGYTGEVGTLILNAVLVSKLTNDNQAEALKITPDSEGFYSHIQATAAASIEAGETVASCASNKNSSATVWYQYTPKSKQRVAFNTLGSDYDTVLSVWSGEKQPLTELACNDDNAMPQSQLGVELESGKTYYISVATIESESMVLSKPTGLLVFNMTPPPENDDRLNAIQITEPFPYTAVQYTGGATLEAEEVVPSCSPEAAASVWYLFAPKTNYEGVTFSTATSGYDTVLSIWQTQGSSLVELGCNDNSMATEQSNTSQVTIPVTKDVNYYVDISGANEEMGNLIFQVDKSLGRDFNITQQPQNQSIASNQTATLTVELSNLEGKLIVDGGTASDQWEAFVALPINYQWYQGPSGDISQPVGTNSYTFTTPPLTATTAYWVRITNPTGSVDSEMAKVIVDGNDTIPPTSTTNGIGIDPQYNNIPTTAHFTGQITSLTTGLSGNDMEIEQPEIISVNSIVDVDPNHVGQAAEIVMVGVYTNSVAQNAYMRNGNNWEIWDWNIANLAAAEPAKTLADKLNISVFNGSLAGMPGHFTGYVGYRLPNGNVFYSGKPMTLVVK